MTDEALIRAARGRSNHAIETHDVDAILAEVDSLFHITVGNGQFIHDRAAMAETFAAQFARFRDMVYTRTAASVEVGASGSLAFETGTWVGTWTTPSGALRTGGRYSASWSKDSGTWKIRAELFVTLY